MPTPTVAIGALFWSLTVLANCGGHYFGLSSSSLIVGAIWSLTVLANCVCAFMLCALNFDNMYL